MIMPLDILIAHKAINLSTDLSNADRRVAGVLLDHFNRKTGQCDPGQNAVAELIGMSRRTVIRSVERLERLGLFRKVRHGGKYHRNQYEPVWGSFRTIDAAWCVRRKNRKQIRSASNMSPSEGQTSHVGGDSGVNQTFLNNQFDKTSGRGYSSATTSLSVAAVDPARGSPRSGHHTRRDNSAPTTRQIGPPSTVAARDSAERRWNVELLDRYGSQPLVLARIVEAIDSELISSTTVTEMQRPGAGLAFLMKALAQRETGVCLSPMSHKRDGSAG